MYTPQFRRYVFLGPHVRGGEPIAIKPGTNPKLRAATENFIEKTYSLT